MRRYNGDGNFILVLLINMLLNLEWTIPAWLLLACHFFFGLSIIWFWASLGLWILSLILWMLFMGWATKCSNTPDKPQENKNPYSVGARKNKDE